MNSCEDLKKLRERVESWPVNCASPQTVVIGVRNMLGWFIDYLEGKPITKESSNAVLPLDGDSGKGLSGQHGNAPSLDDNAETVVKVFFGYTAEEKLPDWLRVNPQSLINLIARIKSDSYQEGYSWGLRRGQ